MGRSPCAAFLVGLVLAGAPLCAQDCPRVVSILPYISPSVVAAQGGYAYFATGSDLLVVDITQPTTPRVVPPPVVMGWIYDVALSGSIAYVAHSGIETTLAVVDLSTPAAPVVVNEVDLPWTAQAMAVSGNLLVAVVPGWAGGLRVLDISQPTAPVQVGAMSVSGPVDVAAAGDRAYLVGWDHVLRVVDLSSPSQPVTVGSLSFQDDTTAVAVAGGSALVGAGFTLHVVDVSQPASPVEVGSLVTPSSVRELTVVGSTAYLANDSGGLRVVDVSEPTSPVEVGSLPTASQTLGLSVSGGRAVLAEGSGGARIVDVSNPSSPSVLSHLSGGPAGDVVVSGNLAFVEFGYPWQQSIASVAILDISNLERPVELAVIDLQGKGEAFAAEGSYAYAVTWSSPPHVPRLRVFDVSNPTLPVQVGSLTLTGDARDLAVSGEHVYLVDELGFRVFDVSDPANPFEQAFLPVDTPSAPIRVAASGPRAYVGIVWSYGEGGGTDFGVIDVSEPGDPVWIGSGGGGYGGDVLVPTGEWFLTIGEFCFIGVCDAGVAFYHAGGSILPRLVSGGWVWSGNGGPAYEAADIAALGHLAFVVASSSYSADLRVIDMAAPFDRNGIAILELAPTGVSVARGHVLVSDWELGLLILDPSCVGSLFADGFESGTTSAWSATVP